MFVPADYEPPDPRWVREIITGNPLALLVTNGDGTPHATHVPVIPRRRQPAGTGPDLVGSVLVGHLNRVNPHWAAMAGGGPALLVFSGPHAYVSPTVYGTTPAAPTWDFTAVHIRGTLRRIEAARPSLGIITATVRALEERFGAGWDMRPSMDYFRRILPGVGAFELRVETVEAMFKLSQEQPADVRGRVARSFAGGRGAAPVLADLMERLDGARCPGYAAGTPEPAGDGCP